MPLSLLLQLSLPLSLPMLLSLPPCYRNRYRCRRRPKLAYSQVLAHYLCLPFSAFPVILFLKNVPLEHDRRGARRQPLQHSRS